jgi:NitT/TauT family transport system substrate-binding protein
MKLWKSSVVAAALMFSCAASAETVRITNIGHGYYSGALYIAKREKLFEKYGLEPDISFVQGGALALQAALTKQSDVSIVSYEHILTSAVQGKQVVAFFNIANRPVNNVIGNEKLVAGSEKLSVEERIKKLKGMRVAMPSAGGSGEKMLGVLAKKYGLTLPGDITSVYLGAEAPSYVAAFDKNLIDAALPFEPAGVLVEQAGKGRIYLNMMSGEVPEVRDILFMVLATHPDNIKQKPETLRKVAAAFSDAVQILKGDPKRGKSLMALEYAQMTPETNDKAYDIVSQIWSADGRMTEAQARATFAYLQPSGPQQVDFASTFTNDFLPKK